MTSSDVEVDLTTVKKKKSKSKSKKNDASASNEPTQQVDDVRGPDWAYAPPVGYTPFQPGGISEEFDWDSINDDDMELWVMRVPNNIKTKHLENLKIMLPESSAGGPSVVGSLQRKHVAYDVWSLSSGSDAAQASGPGGEELLTMTSLLPSHNQPGNLRRSRKDIVRHLVLTANGPTATPPQNDSELSLLALKESSQRYRHPPELLKHRFMPYGSATQGASDHDMTLVDTEHGATGGKLGVPDTEAGDASPEVLTKTKKRKGDGETPKKSKKAKT